MSSPLPLDRDIIFPLSHGDKFCTTEDQVQRLFSYLDDGCGWRKKGGKSPAHKNTTGVSIDTSPRHPKLWSDGTCPEVTTLPKLRALSSSVLDDVDGWSNFFFFSRNIYDYCRS